MSKNLLYISTLVFLTVSCTPGNQPNSRPQQNQTYQDDNPNWSGPGYYWGDYIDNEDDYRNHPNNQNFYGDQNRYDGGDRGGGHGGEGGHGGGGHH